MCVICVLQVYIELNEARSSCIPYYMMLQIHWSFYDIMKNTLVILDILWPVDGKIDHQVVQNSEIMIKP